MSRKTEEKWKSSKRSEKRVIIAKDVIKQINNQKIKPNTGSYINAVDLKNNPEFCFYNDDNFDVKENYKNLSCSACALGSLMLVITSYDNNLQIQDFKHENFKSSKLRKMFYSIFSKRQLALIELAFEVRCTFFYENVHDLIEKDKIDSIIRYYETLNPYERMMLIMKNIIKNNGTFMPNVG